MDANHSDVRAKYAKLTRLLIERALTVTTMESATAGQIASLITDTPGASAVLKGAYVTYSNEAKVACGVPQQVIDDFGVYSDQTASAMAQACAAAYGADIGIGVTGTFGNVDLANADSVAGQVHFAFFFDGAFAGKDAAAFTRMLTPQASRLDYKMACAELVIDELLPLLG